MPELKTWTTYNLIHRDLPNLKPVSHNVSNKLNKLRKHLKNSKQIPAFEEVCALDDISKPSESKSMNSDGVWGNGGVPTVDETIESVDIPRLLSVLDGGGG